MLAMYLATVDLQTAAANDFVSGLIPVVSAIRSTGAGTLDAITRALNDRGIRSARADAGTSRRSPIYLRVRRTCFLAPSLSIGGRCQAD